MSVTSLARMRPARPRRGTVSQEYSRALLLSIRSVARRLAHGTSSRQTTRETRLRLRRGDRFASPGSWRFQCDTRQLHRHRHHGNHRARQFAEWHRPRGFVQQHDRRNSPSAWQSHLREQWQRDKYNVRPLRRKLIRVTSSGQQSREPLPCQRRRGGAALTNIRATASNNIVGGTAPGAGNTIAFNGSDGLSATGALPSVELIPRQWRTGNRTGWRWDDAKRPR